MATDVDIANMSLGHLGTRATISDLNENSTESREISRWYATVRDTLVSKVDWNFSRVYLALASGGTPPARWAYSYAYPSDCLKFRGFDWGSPLPYPACLSTDFEVASDGTNRFIYCNYAQAIGVYSQRVTDPNRFEPAFAMAFSVSLAAMTALPITQKLDLKVRLEGEAQVLIEQAMASDANEQAGQQRAPDAESIRVRGYANYFNGNWPWTQP